jgi:uroporphyrinogen-III synthase
LSVPMVIIRPEPGCSASLELARGMPGVEAHGFPLFEVSPRSWEAVAPDRYDAMLIGSGMVFRQGGRGLGALRSLPVYAVGETTAVAAREAGFTVIASEAGSMQAMLGQLDKAHKRLLRLAGEERISLTLPKGVTVEERVVYASAPRALPPELVTMLRSPAIVALHSAEAARHLTSECVRHGIKRAPIRLAVLSGRIGAAAGDGWGEVASVPYPEDKALLVLARQMCQDPWPGSR